MTGLKLNKTHRAPASNALADPVDRDGTAMVSPEAIRDLSPLETRKDCVKLPKAANHKRMTAGLEGFEENFHVEDEGVHYLRGDTFLAADETHDKEKVKVYNLSGCSAIFVIGADNKPTTFHITAGHEARLAKIAGTYLQAQTKAKKLTPKNILVYTREGGVTNYNEIVKALGADLTKLVTHKTYNYNPATASAMTRWQIVLTVGTNQVEAQEYDMGDCDTGVPV